MESSNDLPVDRRQFIAGAGAAMLGGCVSCPDLLTDAWLPGTGELADAHAHFFNMSDLPMEGFIAHVLIPNRAPHLAGSLKALLAVARWLKDWSPTVREEWRGLYPATGRVPEHYVDAPRFSRALADRINANAAPPRSAPGLASGTDVLADPEISLAESYGVLAIVLKRSVDPGAAPAPGPPSVSAQHIEAILAGETRSAVSPAPPASSPCAVTTVRCADGVDVRCEEPLPPDPPEQFDEIAALIRWVWEMMQGRCNHVRDYLARTRSGSGSAGWRPQLVVHHLVDYDSWLGDGPSTGSSHDEQIGFWTDYAQDRVREVQLVTFGGYDPLKHAEQRLLDEPRQFERLKAYFRNGKQGLAGPKIGGFKLYPPMGFKPAGNLASDYRGTERARGIVSRRWRDNPLLGEERIGEQIDASLADFYRFCIDERAPVLSHSILGNQAACCFGQRANPSHWADLFDRKPEWRGLRLCLGHIVNEAECFAESVENLQGPNPQPAPPHVWALHGTARLLRMAQAGNADVYADIGYLSEILRPRSGSPEDFAARFFRALKWYCGEYDPNCERILFGTDWIMIGQEVGYRHYVELVLQGMAQAGWPEPWQRNLLHNNLRRFLAPSGNESAR